MTQIPSREMETINKNQIKSLELKRKMYIKPVKT